MPIADFVVENSPAAYYSSDSPAAWMHRVGSQWLSSASDIDEEIVRAKIGHRGLSRIQLFREFAPGWDFGSGAAMSEHGYLHLKKFLHEVALPENKIPSVFMTTAGNLELVWESPDGRSMQVEFGADRIEYFRGDTGVEDVLPPSKVAELAAAMSV